jgi:DNA-binding NarL/FixJ family response regulator
MSRRRRDIRRLSPSPPRRILRPMNGVGVMSVHHDEEARRAARAIVNGAPGFDMVGEAGSAEEALELAMALRPSLALVAVGMPGIDGFETSRRLIAALPSTTVVLLYASVEPSEETLVGSQAVAALQDEALTPAALRTLWNEHGAG